MSTHWVPVSLPNCSCSERSSDGQVFTCRICCLAAVRMMEGERVDQGELFTHLDGKLSVSDLGTGTGLTHISDVLRSSDQFWAEDLPF